MASVKLEHIYKVYPGGVKAVNDMTLDIKDGEFIVIVGPSGCGKSTTLRMIAGLEEITAGELYIGDQIVNDMEPKDRDIAMVFQNYALYPHMTVYENMAFGLKLRHVPNDIIQTKVMWAANILGLTNMLDRKPRAMSGGQRQRVALGRAILRDPKVMLLDEPLSNLDAKLRTQMRTEIANLHRKLNTTFIYVTHDQTEAMTLGDRIVVMKAGRVQQFDTPRNLYEYPSNMFVAGFIGTPQMNFYDALLKRAGDKVEISLKINNGTLVVPFNDLIKVNPLYLDGKHQVVMGIRCERISLTNKDDKDGNVVPFRVSHIEELGSEALVYGDVNLDNQDLQNKSGQITVKVKTKPDDVVPGVVAYAKFDMAHTYFFDKKTEETIVPLIPTRNVFDAKVEGDKLSFLGQVTTLPKAITAKDSEGELSIPNNAFLLGKGPLKAKVVAIETIGDTKLIHLESNGRTFFAISPVVPPVGSEIPFDLDFTALTFVDGQGDEVISPLPALDEYHAAFYNYKTVIAKDNDPDFPKAKAARESEAKAFYATKLKDLITGYKTNVDAFTGGNKAKVAALEANLEKVFKSLESSSISYDKAADAIKNLGKQYSASIVPSKEESAKKAAILEPLASKAKADVAAIDKEAQEKIKGLEADYKAELDKEVVAIKEEKRVAKEKKIAEFATVAKNASLANTERATAKMNIKLVKIDYKADLATAINDKTKELEAKYKALIDGVKADAKAKIALATKAYDDKENEIDSVAYELRKGQEGADGDIADVKAKAALELSDLKRDHKVAVLVLKAKNKHIFFQQKAEENIDLKKFLETNKDRDAIKRRKQDHHVFMEALPDQKINALNQDLNGEGLVYDSNVSKNKASTKRLVQIIAKKKSDLASAALRKKDYVGYLTKDFSDNVRALGKQRDAAIKRASLIFFFGVNNFYFLSNVNISNKLIQGLGTSVFTKEYRLDVPHDAYSLVPEGKKGIEATVEDVVDYGFKSFAKISYKDAFGDVNTGYVSSVPSLKKGQTVKLAFDVTKAEITETGMGIRLY